MYRVILIRHGESIWNMENRFTGWTDIDLSPKGYHEANNASDLLKKHGFTFDLLFTSVLKRAIRTSWVIQDCMDLMWVPVVRGWQLNERHYGALQGLNKEETAQYYGKEQVFLWRRSYEVRPPALRTTDPRHPFFDPKYALLEPEQVPACESLQDTYHRVLPYWNKVICPEITQNKKVLIIAHGNSLRALVKYLDNISDADIPELNIPTGQPLIYEFDTDFTVIRSYYLV